MNGDCFFWKKKWPGSENDHKSILDGYRSGELSEEEIRICARRVLKLIDKLRSSYLVMSK